MATSVQIPIIEYLHTSYTPDREYVDGDVLERNLGKFEHARIQALLTLWFGTREKSWGHMVVTEQRTQVSPTRVRIPDVALIPPGPHPEVLVDPPLLVIEILSPDDTYSDTQRRAVDYQEMGVRTVWIIDPVIRTGWMSSRGEIWKESSHLTVADTAIYVDLPLLFDNMQELN
jgi:Uma2 family endonuclease